MFRTSTAQARLLKNKIPVAADILEIFKKKIVSYGFGVEVRNPERQSAKALI